MFLLRFCSRFGAFITHFRKVHSACAVQGSEYIILTDVCPGIFALALPFRPLSTLPLSAFSLDSTNVIVPGTIRDICVLLLQYQQPVRAEFFFQSTRACPFLEQILVGSIFIHLLSFKFTLLNLLVHMFIWLPLSECI